MQVRLVIAEDEELRSAVKDMLRGAVLSLTRDELKAMVAAAVAGMPHKLTESGIRAMLHDMVQKQVQNAIPHNSTVAGYVRQTIKDTVKQTVEEKATGVENMLLEKVESTSAEIIFQVIQQEVGREVKKQLASILQKGVQDEP